MKRQYAIYVIFVLLILIGFGTCMSLQSEKNQLSKKLAEATDKFIKDSLKNGQELIIQKQNLADERNAKSYLEHENAELAKKLKKVQAVVSTTAKVEIKEKIVEYHDTILKYAADSSLCIPVGTLAGKENEWYRLTAVVDTFGLSNLDLSVNFNSITVLGTPKQKFIPSIFKPAQPSVIQTYDNPNVKITATNNTVVYKTKKPKRGVWLAVGIAVGIVGGLLIH